MRPLFLVLAKLLGLLQVYWALLNLSQIAMVLPTMCNSSVNESGYLRDVFVYTASYLLINLIVAWFLLMRTDWLADKLQIHGEAPIGNLDDGALLRTGVRLIGVYVLVYAIPAFVKTMLGHEMFTSHVIAPLFWQKLLPVTLQIILGILLTCRTERILAFIAKSEQTDGRRIFLICLGVFFLVLVLSLAWSSDQNEMYETTRFHSSTTVQGGFEPPRPRATNEPFRIWGHTGVDSQPTTNGLQTTNWEDLKIKLQ